jgi:hypothetical protein
MEADVNDDRRHEMRRLTSPLADNGSFGLTHDEALTEARLAADSQLAALNG